MSDDGLGEGSCEAKKNKVTYLEFFPLSTSQILLPVAHPRSCVLAVVFGDTSALVVVDQLSMRKDDVGRREIDTEIVTCFHGFDKSKYTYQLGGRYGNISIASSTVIHRAPPSPGCKE
jgi:hypothetical protein